MASFFFPENLSFSGSFSLARLLIYQHHGNKWLHRTISQLIHSLIQWIVNVTIHMLPSDPTFPSRSVLHPWSDGYNKSSRMTHPCTDSNLASIDILPFSSRNFQ
jgi:hypothetical protein